jgi:hypothetical protein
MNASGVPPPVPSGDRPRELGLQPLDQILVERNLSNTDLVRASTEQLTHKMVNKGRRGRRLTSNVKHKILNALNRASSGHTYTLADLFNY